MKIWCVLLLAACAAPQVVPTRALNEEQLVVDSPTHGLLVREPELDVSGHFRTEDGKGWVWVESTQATVEGDRFVAHHVPLREGKMDLQVELTDTRGRKKRIVVPVVVETHDRPRSGKLCDERGCVAYETRGRPVRDAGGKITNAVVVVSAYGFDEKLDELWPDLVGPGRALDSRRFYIVGVAPPEPKDPAKDTSEQLVYALFAQLGLDHASALVGASSFGAELVLRLLAHEGRLTGPALICGGHDRPYEEPPIRQVYALSREHHGTPQASWRRVAQVMVPSSYTPAYLANPAHAVEHGLVAETARVGLTDALVESQAAYFLGKMSFDTLTDRMQSAMDLERAPLVFDHRGQLGMATVKDRTIVLVANKLDRMMSIARVQALADRLKAAGAHVELRAFDDELGHSAFFRHVPMELAQGVALLLAGRP